LSTEASANQGLSVMFALAGDEGKASSRVRGYWIVEQLRMLGVSCAIKQAYTKLQLLMLLISVLRFDVVVFQKTYSRYHLWILNFARFVGKQAYLDIDDAPSRTQSARTLKNATAMMQNANAVFCGSQALFDYASERGSRCYLIPSGVRLENYPPRVRGRENHTVCLGWIGNGAHYADDLVELLVEPFGVLAETYSVRFKIVGACGVAALYSAFESIPGVEVEFVDQIEWSNPEAVAEAMYEVDIGLYPLLSNDFNKFKCGFKALEYMAMGIPVVASPVAVNGEIVADGVEGFLADTTDAWVRCLTRLVESSELRERMGMAGRRKVEGQFDTAILAKQLKDIFIGQINEQREIYRNDETKG